MALSARDVPASLPWHGEAWRAIGPAAAAGTLHHALLLHGPEGLGKRHFAERVAAAVLCAHPDPRAGACGECRSCRLARAGTHPDRMVLEPEEGRTVIGIDAVRDLIARLSLTAALGRSKAVVVEPAERLGRPAANTLLKTLEEPPGPVAFLLVSHRPGLLPATVRSRCRAVPFTPPGAAEALSWLAARLGEDADPPALLALAGGAPLAALAMAEAGTDAARRALVADVVGLAAGELDPVETATRWQAGGLATLVAGLEAVAGDLLRLLAGAPAEALAHRRSASAMQSLVERIHSGRLDDLLAACAETRAVLAGAVAVNEALALERLAIVASRLERRRGPG